jgi:hypothetical protein
MDPSENMNSGTERAEAAHPALEREHEERQPIGETTSIHLSLLLKILVPAVSVLVGGAFTVGKWMAGRNSGDDQVQRKLAEAVNRNQTLTDDMKKLTHGIGAVITSMDTSDTQVENLIQPMKAIHADSEMSIYLNWRGLNVYREEKTRAAGRPASFRRTEIERALRWFKKAQELDGTSNFPYWNAACMFGLLHNADEAVRSLADLDKVVPPSRRSEFEQRLTLDTDLCPIDEDTVFRDYVRNQWKVQRQARCPK